ncbi:MAG: hypothetical protein ACRCZM_11705 [Bacteroidales bacterium]
MGYIRIPKELINSEMWMYELSNDTKTFFIHLLNEATYKRCSITFMREIFDLEAGQVVMTQRDMANTLCIKDRKVRTMIDNLKNSKLITTKIAHSRRTKSAQDHKLKRTIVTICNIHHYSGPLNPETDSDNNNLEIDFRALNRKEEIKEYIKTKGGSQKEPIQEEDMVELLSSHPRHSESLYFDGWIESLKDQLNLPKDTIVDQIRIFAKHKEMEGNKRLPISIFRHYCRLFIKEKFPNQKSKYNARQERQPERIYNRLPEVEELPEFTTLRDKFRALVIGSNDGVEPTR